MDTWVIAPPWMSDAEIDALERMSRDPLRWPESVRHSLPAIRDIITTWQAQRRAQHELSVAEIERRIGGALGA